jgi:hypothetical protein
MKVFSEVDKCSEKKLLYRAKPLMADLNYPSADTVIVFLFRLYFLGIKIKNLENNTYI